MERGAFSVRNQKMGYVILSPSSVMPSGAKRRAGVVLPRRFRARFLASLGMTAPEILLNGAAEHAP